MATTKKTYTYICLAYYYYLKDYSLLHATAFRLKRALWIKLSMAVLNPPEQDIEDFGALERLSKQSKPRKLGKSQGSPFIFIQTGF